VLARSLVAMLTWNLALHLVPDQVALSDWWEDRQSAQVLGAWQWWSRDHL